MDLAQSEARAAASGDLVHLLDGGEHVIDGVRFLGATLWTDFELGIETSDGRRQHSGLAMRRATNLMNDYTLIRAADELAEPDTWRSREGRKLRAEDTLGIHQGQRAWLSEKLAKPFAGPTVVVTHHVTNASDLGSWAHPRQLRLSVASMSGRMQPPWLPGLERQDGKQDV
jgi:hypothetical protein